MFLSMASLESRTHSAPINFLVKCYSCTCKQRVHLHAAASWKIGQNARWDQPCAGPAIPAIYLQYTQVHDHRVKGHGVSSHFRHQWLHCMFQGPFESESLVQCQSRSCRTGTAQPARALLYLLTSTANAVHSSCTKPALCKRNGIMQMPPR